MDWATIQAAIRAWVIAGTGLDDAHVIWADGKPRPESTYVAMSIPDLDAKDYDWVDVQRRFLSLPAGVVSAVDTTLDKLTIVGHQFKTGDGPLRAPSTGTYIGGLAPATNYFAIKLDADHVQLATTFLRAMRGHAIDLTSAGTGTRTVETTPTTIRQGEEIDLIARGVRRMELQLQCFSTDVLGAGTARGVLSALIDSQRLPSQWERLRAARLGLTSFSSIQTIDGVQNSTVFEARAIQTLVFYTVSEIRETATIIERAAMTDVDRAKTILVPKNDA